MVVHHFGPLSLRVTRSIRCLGFTFSHSNLNHLYHFLFFKIILFDSHTWYPYQHPLLWEVKIFNSFSRTYVLFTIVVLNWYNFTSYSIVLPISISDRVFQPRSTCFSSIIYVTSYTSNKGLAWFNYCVIYSIVLFLW